MFRFKKINIYFLILLFFIGIIFFKNIYVENQIYNTLKENNMTKVSSIVCNGFFTLNCELEDISFEKTIGNTNYRVNMQQANLLNFNIFENYESINDFELRIKNMTLVDSRNAFLELKKPMDLNVTLSNNIDSQLIMNLVHESLCINVKLIFENNETCIPQSFSSITLDVNRENDVIKKIIHEIYKVKLLEIIEKDDTEFSTTRGMNIPLGIDSSKVIPLETFLGEPYEAMSILLISELETFDWIMEYNDNDNISTFVSSILKKNGVNKLKIQKKKEN